MGHVFLSYASADRHFAELIDARLRTSEIEVWLDRDIEPGEPWSPAIESALASAGCVVVLWSRSSVESQWVSKEARFAERRGVLLPALLDHTRPPLEFDHLQTVDLASWDGDPRHPQFAALLRAINARLAAPAVAGIAGAASPLQILDLADGARIAGAPSIQDVRDDLRRRRRRERWMRALWGCAMLGALALLLPISRSTAIPTFGRVLLFAILYIAAFIGLMRAVYGGGAGVSIAFPGRLVERHDSAPPVRSDVTPTRDRPSLVFITEDVDCGSDVPGKWDLTIFLSLFNCGAEPMTIYDIHANVYLLSSGMEAMLNMAYSESIAIYETNSTLRSGRRVTLVANESQSVRLRLQIAKRVSTAISGKEVRAVSLIFGLFADVHVQHQDRVVDYRVPSDALFCFAGQDERFYFLRHNNIAQWARHAPAPAFALRVIELLRKHNAAVSLLH